MANELIKVGKDWFESRGWKPFPFQLDAWQAYLRWKKRTRQCTHRKWEDLFVDDAHHAGVHPAKSRIHSHETGQRTASDLDHAHSRACPKKLNYQLNVWSMGWGYRGKSAFVQATLL